MTAAAPSFRMVNSTGPAPTEAGFGSQPAEVSMIVTFAGRPAAPLLAGLAPVHGLAEVPLLPPLPQAPGTRAAASTETVAVSHRRAVTPAARGPGRRKRREQRLGRNPELAS